MSYYQVTTTHACSKLPMGFYRPPQEYKYLNYNDRPEGVNINTIVVHYTVLDYPLSYKILSHADGERPIASVHYMINADGRIDNLVDDYYRAWHAGVSEWKSVKGVNDYSIGIELVNPGSGEQGCFAVADEIKNSPDECVRNSFPVDQISALKELIKCLKEEHPTITDIIGHSDIAPGRKIDPGVMFPWEDLARDGIGIYANLASTDNAKILYGFGDSSESVLELKHALSRLGYSYLDNSPEFDKSLANVVRAFHFHYNQNIDNEIANGIGWGDWTNLDEVLLGELIGKYNTLNDVHSIDEL